MAKIFLTGYMGSGKSSAGKTLASQLGYEFIDLDKFVEQEYKMTIPEIFSTKGEKEFRAMEHNSLMKVIEKENIVVACGGGTPCYYNNMELMNNNGTTVYLKMSVESLVNRLMNAKEKRPLILNKDEKQLREFVNRQLEKREDIYHQAQYIVKAKDLNVNELASFIKEQIAEKVI
ncbi:MAG: shikimate kinase [Bacteroidetes bacterium RIFCSPLOWO2_12_FULL_31_6]|nr:MAG: shikimate kinase [Bacteroidetes bacterium RIFCSPLOWO2_12_FULL_31_6]